MLKTFRWSLSLGAKFVRVVPLHTLTIVLLTLVSQIATLLASFLPLKVVILLGSEGMPRYFPASFSQIDRDTLIASLSVATVGFFILVLLSERLIDMTTARSTRHLLAKSHKIVLFENQDEIAANAYQRYSRALAGGVFVFLALLGLIPFYPTMVGVMVGYGVLAVLITYLLHKIKPAFREGLEVNLNSVLKLIGGIGFFAAFGYLVADFIFWNPPSFIVAIVSLLASRQISQRATGAIGDLSTLQKQRLKLDALFFHGKALLPEKLRADKTMWPLLAPEKREEWVRPVLKELLGKSPRGLKIRWHQLGMPNVAGLEVCTEDECYLIKLFETNRSSLALHEATLMMESLQGFPSLPWVGSTRLGNHHCLVYSLPTGKSPKQRQVKKLRGHLKTQLLAVTPPKTLVQRFQRSRPMLWQRLDGIAWDRLQVAVNIPEQRGQVRVLLAQLSALQQELQALPIAVVIPKIQPEAVWLTEEGEVLYIEWGRWSLEPVGAGWFENLQMLPFLESRLAEAVQQRPSLAKVIPPQVELAALTFAMEQECNRQNFVQALELLAPLLERLQLCREQHPETDFTS